MSNPVEPRTPNQGMAPDLPALPPRLAEMKRRIRAGEHHVLRTT